MVGSVSKVSRMQSCSLGWLLIQVLGQYQPLEKIKLYRQPELNNCTFSADSFPTGTVYFCCSSSFSSVSMWINVLNFHVVHHISWPERCWRPKLWWQLPCYCKVWNPQTEAMTPSIYAVGQSKSPRKLDGGGVGICRSLIKLSRLARVHTTTLAK